MGEFADKRRRLKAREELSSFHPPPGLCGPCRFEAGRRNPAAFAGALLLLGGVLAGDLCAQEAQSKTASPQVRLGSVEAAYSADELVAVIVPLSVASSPESGALGDYLQVSIQFDSRHLDYEGFDLHSGSWMASAQEPLRSTSDGGEARIRGAFLRRPSARALKPGEEELVCQLHFWIRPGSAYPNQFAAFAEVDFTPFVAGGEQPLSERTGLAFHAALESKLPPAWLPTELRAGGVSIYYQSGVEAGGGGLTRRAQDFVIPLYLTSLREMNVVSIGIDYDELILREVKPISPPMQPGVLLEHLPESGATSSASVVTLRFDSAAGGARGPIFRRHVADLVFHYAASQAAGRQVQAIVIAPRLVSQATGAGQGGMAQTHSGASLIEIIEPHFVRGNVDSNILNVTGGSDAAGRLAMSVAPDISDAVAILEWLAGSQGNLPCKDAADINDDGEINITDAVLLLAYLFQGGATPAAPFPLPGPDSRTLDPLGCERPLPVFIPAKR
jgi:hypothetical protein